MTDKLKAAQTPLPELLRYLPADYIIKLSTPNSLGFAATSIPVGKHCHEAADAILALIKRAEDAQARCKHVEAEAAKICVLKDELAAEVERLTPLQYREPPCHTHCEANAFRIAERLITSERDQLQARVNAITKEAETNQKWAFLEWRDKAEHLQAEVAVLRDDNARLQRDLEFASGAAPKCRTECSE